MPPDASTRPQKRLRVLRSISSLTVASDIEVRALDMSSRAKEGLPFIPEEVDAVVNSLENITPGDHKVDWESLRKLLVDTAHLSHKDWKVTEDNGQQLGRLLFPDGNLKRDIVERVLSEGNWDDAVEHAKERPSAQQPWAVLVTGVNGIRKTTSLHQKWFPDLLKEALVSPHEAPVNGEAPKGQIPKDCLPSGENSFFRQLDHMIATLCNEEFATLYALTESLLSEQAGDEPSPKLVQKYTDLKAAIFTRYRTLSELLGAHLLEQAQVHKSNCLMETSGKDVAMFHYVDHFFPAGYNKLALHFTINNIEQAQLSVDRRMMDEMRRGVKARDARTVINTNAGGPYGSQVLPSVQEASERVWQDVVLEDGVGKDWYKAAIQIDAYDSKPWTARAVRPDGSLGTAYTFERKS